MLQPLLATFCKSSCKLLPGMNALSRRSFAGLLGAGAMTSNAAIKPRHLIRCYGSVQSPLVSNLGARRNSTLSVPQAISLPWRNRGLSNHWRSRPRVSQRSRFHAICLAALEGTSTMFEAVQAMLASLNAALAPVEGAVERIAHGRRSGFRPGSHYWRRGRAGYALSKITGNDHRRAGDSRQ